MSTRRTRANSNPRMTANAQTLNVRIPNKDIPHPAVGAPSSATTTTQVNARVANPLFATTLGSSSLNPTQMDDPAIEDFGRDKDLKNRLKNLQPKAFTGEGNNIPKILEEWIMSMEDYFALAGHNAIAQGIMGRAKLEGSAKLWWKLTCESIAAAGARAPASCRPASTQAAARRRTPSPGGSRGCCACAPCRCVPARPGRA